MLVPLFDLKFLNDLAPSGVGTSNRRHSRRPVIGRPPSTEASAWTPAPNGPLPIDRHERARTISLSAAGIFRKIAPGSGGARREPENLRDGPRLSNHHGRRW